MRDKNEALAEAAARVVAADRWQERVRALSA